MQDFKSSTAELRFMKKMKKMKMKNLWKSLFHTLCDIFILFYMFSTLISLDDRLRLKLKVKTKLMYGYNAGPPMAIPICTVLPYCVICMSLCTCRQAPIEPSPSPSPKFEFPNPIIANLVICEVDSTRQCNIYM